MLVFYGMCYTILLISYIILMFANSDSEMNDWSVQGNQGNYFHTVSVFNAFSIFL